MNIPTQSPATAEEVVKAAEERITKIIEDAKVSLGDPLSGETRNERKSLLAASAIGIVMVKAGLIPAKISALGIEFGQINQGMLLKVIAAVVAYFMCAFLIYASADFLAWRTRFHLGRYVDVLSREVQSQERLSELIQWGKFVRNIKIRLFTRPASYARLLFEFTFPLVLSIYSIWILVNHPTNPAITHPQTVTLKCP